MNLRLYGGAFAIMACAVLVACGGGGGSSPAPPTGGNAQPTPTQTPPVPVHSANYTLNGSLSQSDTYTYPAASPLPSTSSVSTVTQTVVTGSSPFPGGSAAVSDLHSIESDAGPLVTSTITEDAWIGFTTQFGATGVGVYGTRVADGNAPTQSVIQTLYSSPQQSDFATETNGATWANLPGATVSETDADGTTASRAIANDGSYTDTQSFVFSAGSGRLNGVITTKADGSGSYTGSLFSLYGAIGLFMSAPSGGTIAVTVQVPAPSPSPGQTAAPPTVIPFATPPAWFSGALYHESDTLTTGVSYPGACAVPQSYGSAGGHVAQVIDSIDPVIGITDHKTIDTYTSASVGPVCVQMSDVQRSYYDYLNDTQNSIYNFATFAGTVQHTTTITEQVTLAAGASVSGARAMSAQQGVQPDIAAIARARFDARLNELRSTRLRALRRYIQTRIAPAIAARGVK